MRKAVVALAGTLDTKSTEYEFVKNEIIKFGCEGKVKSKCEKN